MCNAHNHPFDCTCGFGGDGHSGISFNGYGISDSKFLKLIYRMDKPYVKSELAYNSFALYDGNREDFCKATTCETCGQSIYFIRHNDGSVWVDELGWPWPKHGCYYQGEQQGKSKSKYSNYANSTSRHYQYGKSISSDTYLYNLLRNASLNSEDSYLGIVLSAQTDSTGNILSMDILLMNQMVAPITVRTGFDGYATRVSYLVGKLVYFHFHDKLIEFAEYKWTYSFKIRVGTLALNCRYLHPIFVEGTLLKEEQQSNDVVLTFRFDDYGIKKIAFCCIPFFII